MRVNTAIKISVATALALVAAVTVFAGLPAERASAAAFAVTKTADTNDGTCDSDCSLREAVIAANAAAGHDNIAIPAGTYILTGAAGENASASGDLDVTDSVSFNGAGVATTIIDGGGIEDVIDVQDGAATLILTDLTVTNGGTNGVGAGAANIDLASAAANNNGGGGIETSSGNVDLASSIVDGNGGKGIETSSGNVTLDNSTVSRNGDEGIDTSSGNITLTNSTVSSNADDGILTDDGAVSLNFSTVALNDGYGINMSESGLILIYSSIVANHDINDCSTTVEASSYSMDTDGSCGLSGTGDISDGFPDLGPLQNNGGPTETHALLGESEAIDAAGTGCPEDDQRFYERYQGDACDMGAYEVDGQTPPTATPTQGTPQSSSGDRVTRTPTATSTQQATSTPPPPVSTKTPATGNTGGNVGGVVRGPDTGSGPGGGSSSFGLLLGTALLACAGAFTIAIGRKVWR